MKPSISFIGAGKVSTALGLYFKEKGFEIAGYLSRSEASTQKAAFKTDSQSFTDLFELLENSNVIWITTPDDQIETVASQIATILVSDKNEKLILHASGVHDLTVLNAAKRAGYQTATAHPLLAFGNLQEATEMLADTWFGIEDENDKISKILNLCGNHTFRLDKEQKVLYHAAACVLSNYMVTLTDVAEKIFEASGLPAESIENAVQPLLESVVRNIRRSGTQNALTGPIKRGDANTVEMHLDALQQYSPEITVLYKLLGRQTMQMINDYKLKDILE